jgi:hypothetical protein
MPAVKTVTAGPPGPTATLDSWGSFSVRLATTGMILLLAWFLTFFVFPRWEVLFAALHVDEIGTGLQRLVYSCRLVFKILNLCIAVAAVWILLRKKGKIATNLLAMLLFSLLIEARFLAYAAIFDLQIGPSSSIH